MKHLLVGITAAACFFMPAVPLCGGEKCREFLEGLRSRDYHDVALDYLNAMRTSPMADAAFREAIDFEIGVTLLEGARFLPLKERDRQLDDARDILQKFVAEHPKSPLIGSADRYRASLQIERGRVKAELARQSGKPEAEKKRLLAEARGLFQDAEQSLNAIDEHLAKAQRRYRNIDPKDIDLIRERDQLRSEIILTRLALARIPYDIAQTFESGSQERLDYLTAAAKKYGDYYAKYDRWLVGYSFRIEEARCQKELNNNARAAAILEDLTLLEPVEEEMVRRVRTAATVLALQTYVSPSFKKYGEAWTTFENWENNVERPGETIGEAIAIKYLAGEAALELARGLIPRDSTSLALREVYLRRAKELLSQAARFPGELQLKARLKLIDPLLAGGDAQVSAPTRYEEARDRAILAWGRLQEPSLKPNQAERYREEALRCLRFALRHQPRDAKIDEVNVLRYCLAFLSWATGSYYDAAVLGEFLARSYPDRPEAQPGAKIALLAYDRLANVASEEGNEFERARLEAMAQFATTRWPGGSAADDAWILLSRGALARNDLAGVIEYLGKIAPEAPRRGDADLIIGQALWNTYLQASRLPEEEQPPRARMTAMVTQARKALEDGIGRLRKSVQAGEAVSYPLAAAVLSLSEICLLMGDSEQAAAWLDDPVVGAYALTQKGDKVTQRGNFRVEAMKLALRAYLATHQFDKADRTAKRLENSSGEADATRIYLSLGRKMEEAWKRACREGNPEEAAQAARDFEFVLAHIVSSPADKSTFEGLYWAAEMYMSLGTSLDLGSGKLPVEAAVYYGKAAQVYAKLLAACRADEKFAPRADATTNIQIRLARCLRRLGKFEEAIGVLAEILRVRGNAVDVQRETAYTYQAWGEQEPSQWIVAIRGGKAGHDNAAVVWGWGGIAARTQSSESHQDIFNEARYNLALCRLQYAMSRSGEEQTDLLRQAEHDILVLQRLRPEMGGKDWYNQYDALLRKIQQHLGMRESQQGLKAAEQQASAGMKD